MAEPLPSQRVSIADTDVFGDEDASDQLDPNCRRRVTVGILGASTKRMIDAEDTKGSAAPPRIEFLSDSDDYDDDDPQRPRSDSNSKMQRKMSLFDMVTAAGMPSAESSKAAARAPRKSVMQSIMTGPSTVDRRGSFFTRKTSDVRAQAADRKAERLRELRQQQSRANTRHEIAESRRHFLETKRDAHVSCMWWSCVSAFIFAMRVEQEKRQHFAAMLFMKQLTPIVALKRARMWRARAKEKAMSAGDGKKELTTAMLLKDPMLRLFGEDHLRRIVPLAKQMFFTKGYNLMYAREEGTEAYVIMSGSISIHVRRPSSKPGESATMKVAELGPGAIVGSIGMISGEKRMARVYCETDVVVYTIDRKYFLSSGTDPAIMEKAMGEVRKLHEENMPKIYADDLSGEALQRYHIFQGVDPAVLNQMRADFKPSVLRPGEILLSAGDRMPGLIVIPHGTVEFLREQRVALRKSAIETVANQSDINVGRGSRRKVYETIGQATGKGTIAAEVSGKLIVGGPLFIAREPCHLTIVARSHVDVMTLSNDSFLRCVMGDPAAFKLIRQNASAAMAAWMKPLSRSAFLASVFADTTLAYSPSVRGSRAVAMVHANNLPSAVIGADELLEFGDGCRDAYIIVSGSVENVTPLVSTPGGTVMWPPAPILFFGNIRMSVRVTSRVEVWRLPREHFVKMVRATLGDKSLGEFYTDMMHKYDQLTGNTGRSPIFEEVPGVNMPNPTMGNAPPPPPPPDRAARKKRTSNVTPKHSDDVDDKSPEQQLSPNSRHSSGGFGSGAVLETEGEVVAPPNFRHTRRRSSVTIQSDAAQMFPRGQEAEDDDDDESSSEHSGYSLPFLPWRAKQPPMKALIKDTIRKEHDRRLPVVSPRMSSPAAPAASPKPPSAYPLKPTRPTVASDPYERLFGETDTAEYWRREDTGTAPEEAGTKTRRRQQLSHAMAQRGATRTRVARHAAPTSPRRRNHAPPAAAVDPLDVLAGITKPATAPATARF
jgi:CRP-like cAMP-binding protein